MGPVDKSLTCNSVYFGPGSGGGNSASAMASDVARAGNSPERNYVPGCPRDIGTIGVAGGYVYDDDGNDLMHTFFNPDREGWLWKQGGLPS